MSEAPIIPPGTTLPPMEAKHRPKPKRRPSRRHTAGRFAVFNTFVDMTAGALTRAELLTWLVLYRDTKPDGTTRTAQADIARRAGVSPRAVRFALKRLKVHGLVRIAWQGGFRKGTSVYAVEPLPKHPP